VARTRPGWSPACDQPVTGLVRREDPYGQNLLLPPTCARTMSLSVMVSHGNKDTRSAARDGQSSDRDRQDAGLTVLIRAEHKRSKGRYGAPRIHAELRRQGRRHSRKRIARLMRQVGLAGRAPRRWKKTTIADPAAAARADAIRPDFTADASRINQRWCGDITYIATWEGWLYLSRP
jgi:HTH-like domain